MNKQERNKIFLDAYTKVIAKNDAKLICCLAMAPDGKTVAVMDFNNSVSDILLTIRQFVEGLDKIDTSNATEIEI
jgi:hypothetical protein